ncbi:MAG: phosphate ABC transporter permease subunit PstC [Acidimicrobiia bacterium]|nr:phosphate ABC transporter permease subunit PstC [Acidimicrobiia bacterium]
MTVVDTPTSERDPVNPFKSTERGGKVDPIFRWVLRSSGVLVLAILALMVLRTTWAAWPVFASEGLDFFTGTLWSVGPSRSEVTGTYGAWPFIYGTLVSSALAIIIALPLAICTALYLTQLAPPRIARPGSYLVEMLASVPSIIFGLWGLLWFLPNVLRPVMNFLEDTLGQSFPPFSILFEGPVFGVSYFAAGVVLAIMILPIITAICREVFMLAPEGEKQAAYGLGATRWEVIRKVVLARSVPGVVGGTMLGLGRALGETVAVAMLIGASQRVGTSLLFPGDSMAAVIFNTFADGAPEAIWALFAIGVTLFFITMIVNILARLLVWRIGRITGDATV